MRRFTLISLLVFLASCAEKRYHEDQTSVDIDTVPLALQESYMWQLKKNETFKGAESPLRPKEKTVFKRLSFFTPDTSFLVNARFELESEPKAFDMPTTTNSFTKEVVYGRLFFSLKGVPQVLEVYRAFEAQDDYLFLPFFDKTSGVSTYGGGRYIDLRYPLADSVLIDFNKAYNPYCAYNPKYACALVPSVNTLTVAVEAGEKKFELLYR
jgi:uncharacterized protein (DUF1684 family)